MGVKIASLAQIPSDMDVPYFVYLLTSDVPYKVNKGLHRSFDIFAKQARTEDFVAFQGLVGEFGGEVMNPYSIDGIDVSEILPAILVSTVNPHRFQEARRIDRTGPFGVGEKVILISLRDACEGEDDVYDLARTLIQDMKEQKELSNFTVSQTKKTRFLDSLVLEPNFAGVGVDVKKLWDFVAGHFRPNGGKE